MSFNIYHLIASYPEASGFPRGGLEKHRFIKLQRFINNTKVIALHEGLNREIMLQEILVILTFLIALIYLITKLVWTPPFLKKKVKSGACGSDSNGCGCS